MRNTHPEAVIKRCISIAPRNHTPFRRFTATQAQEGGVQDPDAYCRDLVKKRDYDAFLISQLYPKELRDGFFALRAFYVSVFLQIVAPRS